LKPVLQIQGEKLDAFAKARTYKQAKNIMIDAIKRDCQERFGDVQGKNMHIDIAYTQDKEAAQEWYEELHAAFPEHEIIVNPLSLSVACHIGPGALAVGCSKKLDA
jgi:fatty acid-binding protein DegV